MEPQTLIVSAQWLYDNRNHPDLVVLDATEKENKSGIPNHFEGLQIPGARYFDLKDTFSEKCDLPHTLVSPEVFEKECQKLGINGTSQIVVYDNLGIYFSPRVWWMFKTMGHEKVAVLDGGLPAWATEGYKTEPKQTHVSGTGNFMSHFHPENVKDLHFVKNNLESKGSLIIDARSSGRFTGQAPEPRPQLSSGHMPNSKNVPFADVLEGGKFKTKAQLLEVFQDILADNRQLVFSCGSGLTACITLLACELISDRPKAVYDGSWTEYAQSGLPIEKEN